MTNWYSGYIAGFLADQQQLADVVVRILALDAKSPWFKVMYF